MASKAHVNMPIVRQNPMHLYERNEFEMQIRLIWIEWTELKFGVSEFVTARVSGLAALHSILHRQRSTREQKDLRATNSFSMLFMKF